MSREVKILKEMEITTKSFVNKQGGGKFFYEDLHLSQSPICGDTQDLVVKFIGENIEDRLLNLNVLHEISTVRNIINMTEGLIIGSYSLLLTSGERRNLKRGMALIRSKRTNSRQLQDAVKDIDLTEMTVAQLTKVVLNSSLVDVEEISRLIVSKSKLQKNEHLVQCTSVTYPYSILSNDKCQMEPI